MGYQAWIYSWPESQECIDCLHADHMMLSQDDAICTLNHDKTKEDKCSKHKFWEPKRKEA